MSPVRWLALTALLCSVLGPGDVRAAEATVLAGDTQVTGSRTASIPVRLPKPVTLDLNDISVVQSSGRLTAVALKRDGDGPRAPLVFLVHDGLCSRPGCTPVSQKRASGAVSIPGASSFSGTLPAGRYRIYLVTDGGSATFRLRLPGLPGRTVIRPKDAATASVQEATPSMAEPADTPLLFAGGTTHRTGPQGGINLALVWKRLVLPGTKSAVGRCLYQGAPPPQAVGAPYQTPCPGGTPPLISSSEDYAVTELTPGDGFRSSIVAGYVLPESRVYSSGGYHNSASPSYEAHSQQLWLDFRN